MNTALFIGMFLGRTEDASSEDIKRPVLRFEVLGEKKEGEPWFHEVRVLFSERTLIRNQVGFRPGELFFISGEVCACSEHVLVNALGAMKLKEQKAPLPSLVAGRADLVHLGTSYNWVVLSGSVKDNEIELAHAMPIRGSVVSVSRVPLLPSPDSPGEYVVTGQIHLGGIAVSEARQLA